MDKTKLFTKIKLRELVLKNRVVVSPMCQYMAVDGHVQDWHLAHHSRFALGGVGLAFVEATGVTRNGRITHGCTGIWNDQHISGLRKIVDLYKSQNVAVGIQIGHAGRRASAARPWDGAQPIENGELDEAPWECFAPSAIPEQHGHPTPRCMTTSDIQETIDAFALATQRALDAGFDTIEIHGAHGYLIHSFFSPISNQRKDAYGGDLYKRMQFPLRVTEAVREIWPKEMPLFYRVSAVDGVPGGISIEDTAELAKELKSRGVDVIDCSSGGMTKPATLSKEKLARGYQVPYADYIRSAVGIKTMAVGLIIEPQEAEDILQNEQADLVAIAREMISNPNWTYHAALELDTDNPHDVLPDSYAFHLARRDHNLIAKSRSGN
ncbi:MAG: NADH:flavin oxidoreductase / NADH oxidase [Acidiferrobacteraceae bacterium]|nr:NADH:flavin oxidoreductase / NADH oxidase [Acidiferrobacteraceae bacterium]